MNSILFLSSWTGLWGVFFYLRNQIKHCKLKNVSRGEKSKKKKVKIRTQNEEIVETDMDVWYWTYKKTFIRVRKKQCNVSSRMNYKWFTFKGPQYVRNVVFLSNFLQIFWNIKKAEWLFLSHWVFVQSLEFQWSVPAREICLWLMFFELFEEK